MEYFQSLFDYLGKPAGPELGLKIRKQAANDNIPVQTKEVYTVRYKGKVAMYPVEWLNKVFSDKPLPPQPKLPSDEEDDYPF